MSILEHLTIWQIEISAELGTAEAELATATKEHAAAEAALRLALAQRQQVKIAIADLVPPMATALARRAADFDDMVRTAESGVARAKAAIGNLRYQIEDLQQAAAQIERLLAQLDAPAEQTEQEAL